MGEQKAYQESEEERNARANRKAALRKAAQDKELSTKTMARRGVLLVYTGNGKGKTTAALGLALRALGQGMGVAVVQFTKGRWRTGERRFFQDMTSSHKGKLLFKSMGDGFTWETQDRAADIRAAERAWKQVETVLQEARDDKTTWQMLILDELNSILRYGYLSIEHVCAVLRARPSHLHVVVTGRNADARLMELADTVTEMKNIKHAYQAGMRAQSGIEF
ncbi:MAG: cob(I)yrinic acid a,c-diamide adenosyltransferase [Alphaproteobacteria bacterium GM7ARS4]|nr:cob(I)yrinic acid a,c-diamide adenosyltransferase [Alphaproteobacteria bacterium GM7ARS4]